MSTTGPPFPRSRPSPDAVAQRLGEEMVLVHVKTDRVFTLNRTGARIWELLSAGHDRSEIEQRLLQEFDGAAPEIARDVAALLRALETERLLLTGEGS